MRVVYRPDHPEANENGMVDADIALPRGIDPRVYVISDTMDPLRHMADGKMYDSKAAFRAATKANGCFEIGNDPVLTKPRKRVPLDRQRRREDIKRTIYELRNGIKRDYE
jgi:hypothetical protein